MVLVVLFPLPDEKDVDVKTIFTCSQTCSTKCRSGSTASCNAKRAGSTYRVQGEACGLNLPATADVSSAMGLTRRLAAEVVLAGLVYRRRERGKRRQSP